MTEQRPRQAMKYPAAYASEEADIIAMLKLYWFHTPVGLWVNKLTLERVTEEEMEKIIMSGIELRHRMNQGAS